METAPDIPRNAVAASYAGLTATFGKIFKFMNFKFTRITLPVFGEDDEFHEDQTGLSALFADEAAMHRAAELLSDIIVRAPQCAGKRCICINRVPEFLTWLAGDVVGSAPFENMLAVFEGCVKDIIFFITGDTSLPEMDDISGLCKLLMNVADKAGLIDPKARKVFDTMRELRNSKVHGNNKAQYINANDKNVGRLVLVCLLHIIDRGSEKLNRSFGDGKLSGGGAAEVSEPEQIEKYLKLSRDAFSEYLTNNVLHSDGSDEVPLMPVMLREISADGNGNDIDAEKTLCNAGAGAHVVLGVPGAGKSTLMNNILRQLCDAEGADGRIPVLINIKEIEPGSTFIGELHSRATARRMSPAIADRLLDEGRLFIAVDGINEFKPGVSSEKFLKDLLENTRNCTVVLTGRVFEYAGAKRVIEETCRPRIFRIQDISSATIARFVMSLGLKEEVSRRMLRMFESDNILALLSCPLNLKILIGAVKDSEKEFSYTNRGALLSAFVDKVFERESLEYQAGELLDELALVSGDNAGGIRVDEFIGHMQQKLAAGNSPKKIKQTISSLVSAGLLNLENGNLEFRLDTFREFFRARYLARVFRELGESGAQLPDVADDNNTETFRLMLEIMPAAGAAVLAETLYNRRGGQRDTVDWPATNLCGVNSALEWICGLCRTLPETDGGPGDSLSDSHPGARDLCGNWVVNHMKLMLDQPGSSLFRESYLAVIRAATTLGTGRVIRFILGDRWLELICRLRLDDDAAQAIAECVTDMRTFYKVIRQSLSEPSSSKAVRIALNKIRMKTLHVLQPIQLELLHRHILSEIEECRAKNQVAPRMLYVDCYTTALLTGNIDIAENVSGKIVREASVRLSPRYYNRLLDLCAAEPVGGRVHTFFGKLTPQYKDYRDRDKDNNDSVKFAEHVVRYLSMRDCTASAAWLMQQKEFLECMAGDREALRRVCALVPLDELPHEIASRLYEPVMMRLAMESRRENTFAVNLRSDDLRAYAAVVNNNLNFNSSPGKQQDRAMTSGARVVGMESPSVMMLSLPVVENPGQFVGSAVSLQVSHSERYSGTVTECRRGGGEYCEMFFSFFGIELFPVYGTLSWHNPVLGLGGSLRYSLATQNNFKVLMLRFTDKDALRQLGNKDVLAAITSRLTVFKIGSTVLSPLKSNRYPAMDTSTVMRVELNSEVARNDTLATGINLVRLADSAPDKPRFLRLDYVVGGNKSVPSRLLECQGEEASFLFSREALDGVGQGVWLTAPGSNYHALISHPTEPVEKVIECTGMRFEHTALPTSGQVEIESIDGAVDFFLKNSDDAGVSMLMFMTEAQSRAFGACAASYPVMRFSDGTSATLQEAPVTVDLGSGILLRASLRGAPADIATRWGDTPAVSFSVSRVVNTSPLNSGIYAVTAIPYSVDDQGKVTLPSPFDPRTLIRLKVRVDDNAPESPVFTVDPGKIYPGRSLRRIPVRLKNMSGAAIAMRRSSHGILYLAESSVKYQNIIQLVQFDNGSRYHPDMVAPVIEELISSDRVEFIDRHLAFFRYSLSEHLLLRYEATASRLNTKVVGRIDDGDESMESFTPKALPAYTPKFKKGANFDVGKLDLKITARDGDCFVADAGLFFLLRIPENELPGAAVGQYRLGGREDFSTIVNKEDDERRLVAALNDHIRRGEAFSLTCSGSTEGYVVGLESARWPGFRFSVRNKAPQLHRADLYRLRDGAVEFRAVPGFDGITGAGEPVFVESIPKERPRLYRYYEAVVVSIDPRGAFVECNGFRGRMELTGMQTGHEYHPGEFLPVKCVYADYTGGRYKFKHEEEQTEAKLAEGTIIGEAYINHFDEEEGYYTVNFKNFTDYPALSIDGLNPFTWDACGLFVPGSRIKLKVVKVTGKMPFPYQVSIIPPPGDPFGLVKGDRAKVQVGPRDRFIHFTIRDREYSMQASEHFFPEFMKDLCPDRLVMNLLVAGGYGEYEGQKYGSPILHINSHRQFEADHPIGEKFMAEVLLPDAVHTVVRTADDYYLDIPDSHFKGHWPMLRRPRKGDSVLCEVATYSGSTGKTSRVISPLYDASVEKNATLPPGDYRGKVAEAYLNHRYLVQTDAGEVTAKFTGPEYIEKYFFFQEWPVTVTVTPDGKAVMSYEGVRYQVPPAEKRIRIYPVIESGRGIMVRFLHDDTDCYGYMTLDDIRWTHGYAVLRDEEFRRLSEPGSVVMAQMKSSGPEGTFFRLKDSADNPYMRLAADGMAVGDEVEVEMVRHLLKGTVLVKYKEVEGCMLATGAGRFCTDTGASARYAGERFKARVTKFKPEEGTLEFRAVSAGRNYAPEKKLRKEVEYEVVVRGYAGESVLVQCEDVVGIISHDRNLYERITVTPANYPVGMRLKAEVKKIRQHENGSTVLVTFSISEQWMRRFHTLSSLSALREKPVTGTVTGYADEGLVVSFAMHGFGNVCGIVPREAVLENVEGAGADVDLSDIYPRGTQLEVIPAVASKETRVVFLVPVNCRLLEVTRKVIAGERRVSGTVIKADRYDGYTVRLDNGLTGIVRNTDATHSLWTTDRLHKGERYDFDITEADFRNYRLKLTRKSVVADPWQAINLQPGDKVVATVKEVFDGSVLITHSGVCDYIPKEYMADLAGCPWDAGYQPRSEDFPAGKEIAMRVVKVEKGYRHVTLMPDRAAAAESLPLLFLAEVVHAGDDGLWVRLPDSEVIGYLPDDEISHAGVKASDGFFRSGEMITVSHRKVEEPTVRPHLSRKNALDNPALPAKGKVEVRVMRVAGGKVLAVAAGREVILNTSAFGSEPEPGDVCTMQAEVIKRKNFILTGRNEQ